MKKSKGKEIIKHAAVKAENGMIFLGKCHADCFYQGFNVGFEMSSKAKDQGFFTNKGRYVTREQAAVIAKKAGQLKKDGKRKPAVLLSEDIWLQSERFVYTTMNGYLEVKN
jgi:hypothetical protein